MLWNIPRGSVGCYRERRSLEGGVFFWVAGYREERR